MRTLRAEDVGPPADFLVTLLRLVIPLSCLALVVGCSTFESNAIWDIRLHNDARQTLIVKMCRHGCQQFRYTRRVRPRATANAFDYGDGRSYWVVFDVKGDRVGCLALDYTHRVDGYVLDLSKRAPCPRHE